MAQESLITTRFDATSTAADVRAMRTCTAGRPS